MKKPFLVFILFFSLGLVSCDAETRDKNKVIFIPGESRTIMLKGYFFDRKLYRKYDSKEEIANSFLKSYSQGIKIKDLGDITEVLWNAPFSASGKIFPFGEYIFEVAAIQAMDIKIKGNRIVVSDDECFSDSKNKINSVEFNFSKKININLKDIYFYKITSRLDDKASLIKSNSTRLSCIFTTNLNFPERDFKITFPSLQKNKPNTSLYVVGREFWFVPADGYLTSHPHDVSDNWVKVPRSLQSDYEYIRSLSLGNLYFIGD